MEKKDFIRRSSDQWEEHVRRQEQSGQAVGQYCRDHGLGNASFYNWRKRLKEGSQREGNGFVELKRECPEAVVAHIELPNGWRLTINGGIDEEALVKMIRVVKRA